MVTWSELSVNGEALGRSRARLASSPPPGPRGQRGGKEEEAQADDRRYDPEDDRHFQGRRRQVGHRTRAGSAPVSALVDGDP
jgi:hypothetical protein